MQFLVIFQPSISFSTSPEIHIPVLSCTLPGDSNVARVFRIVALPARVPSSEYTLSFSSIQLYALKTCFAQQFSALYNLC